MKNINPKYLPYFFAAIILVVLLSSCSSSRHVNKTNTSSDSTSLKKSQELKKDTNATTFESKSTTKSVDTATSKADSLKGNFSFNPKDTCEVNVTGESGTMDVNIKFNPSTGKGSYSSKKKQEKIPVNTYHEETKKLTTTTSSLSIKNDVDSTNVSKQASGKNVDSKFDWTTLKWICWLLILLLLIAAYFYVRNIYTRGQTFVNIKKLFKNEKEV